MPPTKPRRRELPENRRACILKAARSVFARQGYSATVVEDIAGQAGIGKGTLYLYFKSKEEIFMAALVEDARRLESETRDRMADADGWSAKLRAYMDLRLEYLELHQDFLRIYLAEIRSRMVRSERMQCDFVHALRESEHQLAQVFAAAVAKQEIRPIDPELAAVTVADLIRGLMERRLLGWCRPSGTIDAQFTFDFICRSLALEK